MFLQLLVALFLVFSYSLACLATSCKLISTSFSKIVIYSADMSEMFESGSSKLEKSVLNKKIGVRLVQFWFFE